MDGFKTLRPLALKLRRLAFFSEKVEEKKRGYMCEAYKKQSFVLLTEIDLSDRSTMVNLWMLMGLMLCCVVLIQTISTIYFGTC